MTQKNREDTNTVKSSVIVAEAGRPHGEVHGIFLVDDKPKICILFNGILPLPILPPCYGYGLFAYNMMCLFNRFVGTMEWERQ